MTDVIFNGTDRRSPMGMAEGSLHFDNRDRALPIDADDVVVTRRLFRSGEGEYLINKRTARLKDVRNLFLGTGLVPGGYAFMEQGKIDSVLASNPVERRRIFEDAAGISRYRVRQREVELKLAKVAENLTRLADIIEEVDRQTRSLKIHAGKARSWLDVNCSMCHRPAGFAPGGLDLRRQPLLAAMNVIDVPPTQGDLGIAGARL